MDIDIGVAQQLVPFCDVSRLNIAQLAISLLCFESLYQIHSMADTVKRKEKTTTNYKQGNYNVNNSSYYFNNLLYMV